MRKILLFLIVLSACSRPCVTVSEVVSLAEKQCKRMESGLTDCTLPRSFADGELITSDTHWWCSGFFPGVCWYTWRLGGDPEVREVALRQTRKLLDVDSLNTEHDLGFQVLPSAYFAYQETGDSLYLNTVYRAAERLAGRFSPVTGVIRSWNGDRYAYPVIIDNMMNLELLTIAARLFGRPEWRDIAVTHAQTTLQHHFRPDGSSYHLVDYNPEDGSVIRQQTVQGYADDSSWARGQAWGLYGFTMMFRETGKEEFLAQAERIARYLLPLLADRAVPAWDFSAPEEIRKQDDASAGAIMASAFLELSTLTADTDLSRRCREQAVKTLQTLCGAEYLAAEGELGGFLLKHSTGNYPRGGEVDVPLTYADYYFMEALFRYRNLSDAVVDCHDIAVKVTDKALAALERGHYTGTCLYSGMADIVTLCDDKAVEAKLMDILEGLASGEIPSGNSGNVISYQIGGQAAAYLAWKGYDSLKRGVEANAADLWANQYRTADGLMTGNKTQDRFRDGVWIDCAFTITPYLLYAGLLTGNDDYVAYAADYTLRLYHLLFDASSGLVFQARSIAALADGEISRDNWSRSNGWLSMALVALLRDYPADGPRRAEIEQVAHDFYTAVLKYQDVDGMWHQEVSDPTTFVETSGSALLLAGIGQAIESGILPKENLADFKRGLAGLLGYVDPDGSVGHTCQGTLVPGKGEKADYAFRHFYYNEPHAFGPVVLALAQAIRLGIKRVSLPAPLGYKNDLDRPRCYVRYVAERKGDVAWENDMAAYRVYSLQIPEQNHVCSGVDLWAKSVDYPVIDHWYKLNNEGQAYHIDRGEGCDFYVIGKSRGIGGTGVWAADSLWTSHNYSDYEIVRNDPSRLAFTLSYAPYQAGDVTVTEHKRIDMVLGSPLFRITSTLETSDGSDAVLAVGLTDLGKAVVTQDKGRGLLWLDEWVDVPESTVHPCGSLEWIDKARICSAVVGDPARVKEIVHTATDAVMLLSVKSGEPVVTYAGAIWNEQRGLGGKHLHDKWFAGYLAEMDWDKMNKLYAE